ncbi:S8 family serine peptidase [candidate division KSB1 bacterium]|nr:S8 family serine peptidase [candidate division KSB1 bacterium]
MKFKWICFLLISLFFTPLNAQSSKQPAKPANLAASQNSLNASAKSRSQLYHQQAQEKYDKARQKATEKGWPVRKKLKNGQIIQLKQLAPNGMPQYYATQNVDAARTIGTDKIWPGGGYGFNLDGQLLTIGEWDAGAVRRTHLEFDDRVIQGDTATVVEDHATHVAGTMIASGIDSKAQGMAYGATLYAHDWNDDEAEMVERADGGMQISNHSYGVSCGWSEGYLGDTPWTWLGDVSIDSVEDYEFGFYSDIAQQWDEIGYYAPDYLIVKAAGNDRNDTGPNPGEPYWYYDTEGDSFKIGTKTPNPDGDYDCLAHASVAKNVLTVGAVYDLTQPYSNPADVEMSPFSDWGPTDDGRIKPDLVANGIAVYSAGADDDDSYITMSGTSMASPSAAGSLLLLQQLYNNLHEYEYMKAATLKALAIHTAREAGVTDGPDYQYGWGLLNVYDAARLLRQDSTKEYIRELNLRNNSSYKLNVYSDGQESLKVTICWTDVPGVPPEAAVDPSDKMLVNDLDLRIIRLDGNIKFYPWKLNPANPAAAATIGDNDVDNVEQVLIATPEPGLYQIIVSHKGNLNPGHQDFSLVFSGAISEYRWEEIFNTAEKLMDWKVIDNDGNGKTFSFVEKINLINGDSVKPQIGKGFWSANRSGANSQKLISEWLMSPRINHIENGDSLIFWAGAIDGLKKDSLRVGISTTDTLTDSFTELAYFKVSGPSGFWHRYAFDLSSFSGSGIYIAVVYYLAQGGENGISSDQVWVDHFAIKRMIGKPVPVELSSFNAELHQNVVHLKWVTQTETNNFGFQIERKLPVGEWNSLGFVSGKGTTTIPQAYNFTDDLKRLSNSVDFIYYRLKQIDTDGTTHLSPEVKIIIEKANQFLLTYNHPNPFNPSTRIVYAIPTDGLVQLKIYNTLGQVIRTLVNKKQAAGEYTVFWNGRDETGQTVASGVYFYSLETENNLRVTKRMLLMN